MAISKLFTCSGFFLSLVLTCALGQLASAEDSTGSVALTSATIIDGNGGTGQSNMTVLIDAGVITDIFKDNARPLPKNVKTMNLAGQYLIPGLIDSHVHITGMSDEVLESLLFSGITTLRDLGGLVPFIQSAKSRIDSGALSGPDIYYSAIIAEDQFITTDPRTIASSGDRKVGAAPWVRSILPDSNIPEIVKDAKAVGVTSIKLYAGLSPETVKQLVLEGHKQGLKVWSHSVIQPSGIEDVINAGVDVISHADNWLIDFDRPVKTDYVSDSETLSGWNPRFKSEQLGSARMRKLFEMMKARDIVLDPTLTLYQALDYSTKKDGQLLAAVYGVVKLAHEMGVKIVAGTDAPISEDGLPPLYHNMELLVKEAGLTPLEAITAATKTGAEILGLDKHVGTIEPGKQANIVILNKDPSVDISNVRSIHAVLKNGRLYQSKQTHR